jgi:hypothetical protein
MEHELNLEKFCQTVLKWPIDRIARARPTEMQVAMNLYEQTHDDTKQQQQSLADTKQQQQSLADTKQQQQSQAGTKHQITEDVVAEDLIEPNVIVFSRRQRPQNSRTTTLPLITPMPMKALTTTNVSVKSVPETNLQQTIDKLIRRHHKFSRAVLDKRELLVSLQDTIELEEKLVLECSIEYSEYKLVKNTDNLTEMKNTIEESIVRKTKLVKVLEVDESDDEIDTVLNQSELIRKEHQRSQVVYITDLIGTLKNALNVISL